MDVETNVLVESEGVYRVLKNLDPSVTASLQ